MKIRFGAHRKYTVLFVALMAYFFVFPFLKELFPRFSYLVDAFMAFIIISACYSIIGKRRLFMLGVAMLALGLGGIALSNVAQIIWIRLIANLFLMVFCTMIIVSIIKEVLGSMRVTFDVISGALCGYLLIAFTWGLIYQVIELLWPGSFRLGGEVMSFNESVSLADQYWAALNYFSFVTITTLGYGDVTPVSSPASSLAVLEAVLGQFYLVVLVAWLVGRYTKQTYEKHPSRDDA
jgi:hypothetical protein